MCAPRAHHFLGAYVHGGTVVVAPRTLALTRQRDSPSHVTGQGEKGEYPSTGTP